MKITFILPSYPRKPVGGYKIVYEYANHLTERGHSVNVVHPRKVKNLNPLVYVKGKLINYTLCFYRRFIKPKPNWQFINPKVRLFYIPEPLPRYLPQADVIFATSWAIAKYMYSYPESKGKKCYLFQHYETWSGPKEKVDATWKSSFYKIVVSKWLYMIGLSLGAENMFYIPNGIDFNLFKVLNPIEKRAPLISMMYSKISWKGAKEGIKALNLVKKEFPFLKAIFFGVGKRGREIPEWIEYRENPSQKNLVKEIYNKSSIFLCPSHKEGFALPPAEAMASGCAVVTADCGGVRDFARDKVTALVSPAKDTYSLAENILKLLNNDRLRIKIARNGHRFIQEFNWKKSTDLFEDFLKKIN